jgi:hypothetical protein
MFDTYATQGSGEEGIALEIEENQSGKKIEMKSVGLAIDYDLGISGIVFMKGEMSFPVIIFPEFWKFNHVTYHNDISTGLANFIFDFNRCESKPHD